MNFETRLRELRKEKELTQEELGNKLNLTKASISKYETGRLEPNIETINYLAQFFNVSIDYLLGKSNIRNPYTKMQYETKAYHNLDVEGLSEEDIKKVEEYVEFIKSKYNPDGTPKEK